MGMVVISSLTSQVVFVLWTPLDGVVVQAEMTVKAVVSRQRQRGQDRTSTLEALIRTAASRRGLVAVRLKSLKG